MSIANQLIRKDGTALAEPKKPRRVTGELVDSDAVEIGELYERATTSIVDSVLYQIECGQKLSEKKASMKHGTWLPWLEANAGVLRFASDRTARMLMKAAAVNRQLTSDLAVEEALKISRLTWGNTSSVVTKWTGEDERYTPAKYIEAARQAMGGIDLDPASNDVAQKTVKAIEWFDEEADGLTQKWSGRVFLNPPYSNTGNFAAKLIEEHVSGEVSAAVFLTNNATDTKWWHLAARMASAVCFTAGRISFYDADGREAKANTNGQTFFYFGDDVAAFSKAFSEFGIIMAVVE